eukprot:6237127-Pyramimonas_sp.AAC.1
MHKSVEKVLAVVCNVITAMSSSGNALVSEEQNFVMCCKKLNAANKILGGKKTAAVEAQQGESLGSACACWGR